VLTSIDTLTEKPADKSSYNKDTETEINMWALEYQGPGKRGYVQKKKPSIKNFYNQVTILMKPSNNPTRNYINIKVFKNGSLQMTGCKDMDDFYNVTKTLIKILKKGKNIKLKNGETKHIDFITDPYKIGIYNVKIRMINSNFKLNFKVDRKKLARLLKKNHKVGTKDLDIGPVECKYQPTGGHSCVNIKYQYDEKSKPSIFVFQTGAVIITGAKNLHHIIASYHFINKILNKYYDEIKILELDQNAVKMELSKFFRIRENNILQT
jgi:TATA-box binding protein (TBP) (component of TFIID and TFIIIB)